MDTSRLPSPYHLAAAQSERTKREDHHTTKHPPNIRHPTASRRHLHFDAHDSASNASNSYRSHESIKIRRKGHGNPSHEPSISASSFPLEEYVDPHTPTSSSRRSNRNVPTISRRATKQRTLGSRQQTIPSDNRRNQRGFLDLTHNLGRSQIVSSRRSSIASTTNAIPSPASPRSPPCPPPPPPHFNIGLQKIHGANHIPPHPARSSPTSRHQYDHTFHEVVIPSSSPPSHGSGSRPPLRMGVSAPASVERNRMSFQETPPTFPRRTQSQSDSYRERHYPEQHAPPLFADLRRDRSTDIITLEVPPTPTTPAASSSPHAANRKDLMDICEHAERVRRLVSEIDDMKSLCKVTKRVRLLKRKFQHAYPTYSTTTTSPNYYEHTSTLSPAFAVSPASVNNGPNIVSTNSLNPPSSTGARSTASATDMELDLWVSRRSQLNSQLECVEAEMKEFRAEIEKRENRAKKIERQIAILMKQQSSNDRELAVWRGKYEERSTTQEKWKKQIRRLNEKIEDREMIINLGSEIESNLVWTASSLDEILSDYEMGWRNWSSPDVFAWVCCLDGGRFSRYRHDLKREIIQRNIVGRKLPEVNALVLQCIGITEDTHRQQIIEHRDRLLASHGDSSAHNSYSSLPSPSALVAQTQENRGGNQHTSQSHSSHGVSISSRSRSLSHTSANIYADMNDEKMDESHLLGRRRSRSHSEIEIRKGRSRRNSMSCDDAREEKRRRSRRSSNKTKCVICYEYECDRVCIPCGHICICSLGEKCGKHVLAEAKCPLCRAHVEQLVKVFHAS